jgi:hypothetical protein
MSSSNAFSSQSGSSQGGSPQSFSSQSGSSHTYSSQTFSSQMMNEDDCIMMSDADMLKNDKHDPLNALHEHNFASNPDLDVSILSDDDFFAAYSSQTGYSSQVKYEEECTMMSDADMLKSKEYDPLNALHEQNLAKNPDLDVSVLTDDEYFALLKSAKETKA